MFVTQIWLESSLAQSLETQKAKAIRSLAQSTEHLSQFFVSGSDGKISVNPSSKTYLGVSCKCCEADIEY